MGSESGQLSVLLSQLGDLLLGWGEGEALGAGSLVLDPGHCCGVVPRASSPAAGALEVSAQEGLPRGAGQEQTAAPTRPLGMSLVCGSAGRP